MNNIFEGMTPDQIAGAKAAIKLIADRLASAAENFAEDLQDAEMSAKYDLASTLVTDLRRTLKTGELAW